MMGEDQYIPDAAYIGGAVNVLAIPGFALSVGAAYPLPATEYFNSWTGLGTPSAEFEKETGDINIQNPIEIDLRANYTAGSFNVGFGLGVNLGGSKKIGADAEVKTPLDLGVTLNPAYTLGDTVIGLVGEAKYITAHENAKDSQTLLNFVPYVQHNMGAGHVVLGFQLGVTSNEGADEPVFAWSVPVGINYSF
jgi:hypothetical protein